MRYCALHAHVYEKGKMAGIPAFKNQNKLINTSQYTAVVQSLRLAIGSISCIYKVCFMLLALSVLSYDGCVLLQWLGRAKGLSCHPSRVHRQYAAEHCVWRWYVTTRSARSLSKSLTALYIHLIANVGVHLGGTYISILHATSVRQKSLVMCHNLVCKPENIFSGCFGAVG